MLNWLVLLYFVFPCVQYIFMYFLKLFVINFIFYIVKIPCNSAVLLQIGLNKIES